MPDYQSRYNVAVDFHIIHVVATGQEIVREKKILQGQGRVREK